MAKEYKLGQHVYALSSKNRIMSGTLVAVYHTHEIPCIFVGGDMSESHTVKYRLLNKETRQTWCVDNIYTTYNDALRASLECNRQERLNITKF